MVIVRTSRLSHPTVSCRRADRPGAGPTVNCCCPIRAAPRYLGGPEDVLPERTGLQRSTTASGEAQRPGEGPASLRSAQAVRVRVQGGPPAGEPPPRIGDEGPLPDDDAQQF